MDAGRTEPVEREGDDGLRSASEGFVLGSDDSDIGHIAIRVEGLFARWKAVLGQNVGHHVGVFL